MTNHLATAAAVVAVWIVANVAYALWVTRELERDNEA